jgi:hypothetical protein
MLSEHTFGFQRYKKSFLVSAISRNNFLDSIENLLFGAPSVLPPLSPHVADLMDPLLRPVATDRVVATTIAAAAATVAATVHKTHRQ